MKLISKFEISKSWWVVFGCVIGLMVGSWAPNVAAGKLTILSGYDALFMQGWIADKEGFFKDEGLDLDIKYTISGKVAVDGVVAGAGVMGISASLVSVTAATRAPMYIVAPLGASERLMKFIALKGYSSGADLKGKKIGFQFGTAGQKHALLVLEKHGKGPKDVTLKNIPAQALPAALSNGDIDALSTWPPHSNKALEATPGSTILEDSYGVMTDYGVVVMRKDFVESDPATAGKLMRALLKATKFINENPARTIEYFAEQGNIKLDLAKTIFKDIEPKFDMSIDKLFLSETQKSIGFLHEQGKIKKAVEARSVIYDKVMRDVSPKHVTY